MSRFGRAYRATKYDPTNRDFMIPRRSSPDSDIVFDRMDLVAKSRDLVRNNAIARGMELTLTDYIGGNELTPIGEKDLLAPWKEWARKCGMDGWSFWGDIYRDMIGGQFESGEVIINTPIDPDARGFIKTRLQLIEADRVQTPTNEKSPYDIRDGIAYKRTGREIGYYIAKIKQGYYQTGAQSNFDFMPRFNGNRINTILARRPDKRRPSQGHQVPMLHASIQQLIDIDDLADAIVKRAQALSLVSAFLETDRTDDIQNALGKRNADTDNEPVNNQGDPVIIGDIIPGTITTMPFGTKVHTLTPSGNMDLVALILHFLRQFGASVGMPIEMFLRDYSNTSFSSGRLSFDGAFRMFDRWNIGNVSQFVNWIFRLVTIEAYLNGHPAIRKLSSLELRDQLNQVAWIGGERVDADPLKTAKANQLNIDMGMTTQEIELQKKHIEFEDVVRSKARMTQLIKTIADEFKIDAVTLQRMLLEGAKKESPEKEEEEEGKKTDKK